MIQTRLESLKKSSCCLAIWECGPQTSGRKWFRDEIYVKADNRWKVRRRYSGTISSANLEAVQEENTGGFLKSATNPFAALSVFHLSIAILSFATSEILLLVSKPPFVWRLEGFSTAKAYVLFFIPLWSYSVVFSTLSWKFTLFHQII